MSLALAKILFFTSGPVPTAHEIAAIARLSVGYRNVFVRNGLTAADTIFSGGIEPCDYVAGTKIPAAYTDSPVSKTTLSVPSDINPDQFKLLPAAVSLDASNVDVQQLVACVVTIDTTTGLAKVTDLAADATVTYASSDAGKATVGTTGLLTAVAAGSTIITATLTAGTPLTSVTAAAATDLVTKAAHGLVLGDKVRLTAATGATGLTVGSDYWVIPVSSSTFKLASTHANAVAGTAIDITVDGTSMTIVRSPVTSTCAVTVVA